MKPKGALYAFPRLDPKVYKIKDDRQMVLDLLRAEKIMIVHGTGLQLARARPLPDRHAAARGGSRGRGDADRRFLDGYSQP